MDIIIRYAGVIKIKENNWSGYMQDNEHRHLLAANVQK